MGNSGFFWYPEGSGAVEQVTLGRKLGQRTGPFRVVDRVAARSLSGAQATVHFGATERFRVQMEFDDRSVRAGLATLIAYLQQGHSVTFIEDVDHCYAAFVKRQPLRAQTVLYMYVNALDNLSSGTPVGSEVIVFGDQPRHRYEHHTVSSYSSNVLTLGEGLAYDWTAEPWIFVREIGSHLSVRLPVDQPNGEYLRNTHGNWFELDLPLESNPVAYYNLAQQYDVQLTDTLGGIGVPDLSDPTGGYDDPGSVGGLGGFLLGGS